MKMYRKVIAALLISVFLPVSMGAPSYASATEGYGVFIGADPDRTEALSLYQTVVIDAAYFTKEDINKLHLKGSKVYSYLNIGTIETFREGYADFKAITLDPYGDWPGEYWMDVSRPEWRRFIADAAKSLAGKGIDGFFIDNADVYYHYPSPEIFNGLVDIINGLGRYEKDIVINGGDVFVSEAVLDAEAALVSISGINQECVFTAIDFDNDALTVQGEEDKEYYLEYITRCAESGLDIFITEYASAEQSELRNEIEAFCDESGYVFYIAPSIELD